MKNYKGLSFVLGLGVAGWMSLASASASTLEDVKARGYLACGVSAGLIGFSNPNDAGKWVGFDVDFCHALAAAVFGDKDKVKFTSLTNKERFTALQSGEVDILSRNTTWTFTRDVNLGLEFVGITYYDGQSFMVPVELGVQSALELDGARICIETGTTTELNLADYFRTYDMEYESVVVGTADEARANYEAGACDTYTTDASGLAATRVTLQDPLAHIILPEVISKEPLGPIVRHGDNQWSDITRWTLHVMILGEEFGITSQNVDEMAQSSNPAIRRLLGVEGDFGSQLGLSITWGDAILRQVGNYGEVFEKHLGTETLLNLERGLNGLWSDGGLLYSPPIR